MLKQYKNDNKLIQTLISSDIFYFKKVSNTPITLTSTYFNLNKTKYIVLNIIKIFQSIKQLIRAIQFNTNYYKNFLQIFTTNKFYISLINYINLKYFNKNQILGLNKLTFDFDKKLLISLDSEKEFNIYNTLPKIFFNKLYINFLINCDVTKKIFGNYKIFSKMDNYNKVVLFLLIILLPNSKL